MEIKREKGITLVALIITIIILVILVAVSIMAVYRSKIVNYAINGTMDYAKEGINENRVLEGTEDLIESALESLKRITNAGIVNENIKLKTEKTFDEEYTKGTIHVEIEYEGIIESIHINDKEIEVPEKTNGVYIVEDEVTENGMYIVITKDSNGDYQITNVKVSEILGDMKIYDEADMELFRERVKEGKIFTSTKVEVMKDIELTKEWEPIGTAERQFIGEFEENGHSIKGLQIEGKADNQGLFSFNSGTIQNLRIEDGYIKSEYAVIALLCGMNNGTIFNIETSGTVQGYRYVAGIAGENRGNIEGCTNKAKVILKADIVGGITAYNHLTGIISNCANEGEIEASSSSSHDIGGIAGISRGIIQRSNNIKNISTKGSGVGGIAGSNYSGKIINCFSRGNIDSSGYDSNAHSCTGGIVGANTYNATIENVYHVGSVDAKYTYVGGIVGYNGNSSSGTQTVKNVFNMGAVKCGSETATYYVGNGLGMFIGKYGSLSGQYKNMLEDEIKGWDEDTIEEKLGEYFIKDNIGINDGFPILK